MQAVWDSKSFDLRCHLLHKMSLSLDFDFEFNAIQRGAYIPEAHADAEFDGLIIRKGLIALLTGKTALKMDVQSFPMDQNVVDAQLKQLQLSIEYLEGKHPLSVTLVQGGDTKAIDTTSNTPKSLPLPK